MREESLQAHLISYLFSVRQKRRLRRKWGLKSYEKLLGLFFMSKRLLRWETPAITQSVDVGIDLEQVNIWFIFFTRRSMKEWSFSSGLLPDTCRAENLLAALSRNHKKCWYYIDGAAGERARPSTDTLGNNSDNGTVHKLFHWTRLQINVNKIGLSIDAYRQIPTDRQLRGTVQRDKTGSHRSFRLRAKQMPMVRKKDASRRSRRNRNRKAEQPTLFHHRDLPLCYELNVADSDEKWISDADEVQNHSRNQWRFGVVDRMVIESWMSVLTVMFDWISQRRFYFVSRRFD